MAVLALPGAASLPPFSEAGTSAAADSLTFSADGSCVSVFAATACPSSAAADGTALTRIAR